jgi:hypothetical protein
VLGFPFGDHIVEFFFLIGIEDSTNLFIGGIPQALEFEVGIKASGFKVRLEIIQDSTNGLSLVGGEIKSSGQPVKEGVEIALVGSGLVKAIVNVKPCPCHAQKSTNDEGEGNFHPVFQALIP